MYLNQQFTKNLWHFESFTVLFDQLRQKTGITTGDGWVNVYINKAEEKSQIWHKNILFNSWTSCRFKHF